MKANPAHPEQKKILRSFCEKEIADQRDYLIQKYELREYVPQLFFNFRTNAIANYGGELSDGKPFIVIAAHEVCEHIGSTCKYVFSEYDFLKNKEGIGDGIANWKQFVAWTIAHELAHTLVEITRFRVEIQKFFPIGIASDLREHGLLWQYVYRDLRTNFCIEDRYHVKQIDFKQAVHFSSSKVDGAHRYTFYRGNKAVAWYIRSDGLFFRSTKTWRGKKLTQYKKPSEILKRLLSV